MNIDTKYLIRWGIPGWVFILFTYTAYISVDKSNKSIFTNNFTIPQLLGILVALGFVGVVLGYLMHQIYFSVNWIFSNQSSKIISKIHQLVNNEVFNSDGKGRNTHEDYYMMEFQWQKQLALLDKDAREYIAGRYSNLLGTIHGLGALLVSIIFSLIAVLIICHEHILSSLIIFYILLLLILSFSVFMGFKYYSENLNHFQANFFNSFFAGDFKKNERERIDLDKYKKK